MAASGHSRCDKAYSKPELRGQYLAIQPGYAALRVLSFSIEMHCCRFRIQRWHAPSMLRLEQHLLR